tara:strand:- start:755 stop:931 length:177 start_codon:yes stop_codon:yes gene_type:complete
VNHKIKGVFESEREALDEYGMKSMDEINKHFERRFYELSLNEEKWRISLEKRLRVRMV